MTSSSRAPSPYRPAANAARRPFKPPVWGTVTLLAFLTMLALTARVPRTGNAPSTLFALAIAALVIWSHRTNIKRLLSHTESKTYFFKKPKQNSDDTQPVEQTPAGEDAE